MRFRHHQTRLGRFLEDRTPLFYNLWGSAILMLGAGMDVVVMANTVHGYMSQSDKGEMVIGGGTDGFNNFTQRGSFHHIEETLRALVETFPMISRLKMLRQWGGIVDMTGDRSPLISKTPLGNCFINCGWGTGGFKAIPGSGWAMAELMAKGEPGPLAADFSMWRFKEGRFID